MEVELYQIIKQLKTHNKVPIFKSSGEDGIRFNFDHYEILCKTCSVDDKWMSVTDSYAMKFIREIVKGRKG